MAKIVDLARPFAPPKSISDPLRKILHLIRLLALVAQDRHSSTSSEAPLGLSLLHWLRRTLWRS
jgi:hypothetical protein